MRVVYSIWCKNDDMDDLLIGIATSEGKANEMIAAMEKEFEDTFNYSIVKEKLDTLCINNKEIMF